MAQLSPPSAACLSCLHMPAQYSRSVSHYVPQEQGFSSQQARDTLAARRALGHGVQGMQQCDWATATATAKQLVPSCSSTADCLHSKLFKTPHLEVLSIEPEGLLDAGNLAKVGGHAHEALLDVVQGVIRQRLADDVADGAQHHPVVPCVAWSWHCCLQVEQRFELHRLHARAAANQATMVNH